MWVKSPLPFVGPLFGVFFGPSHPGGGLCVPARNYSHLFPFPDSVCVLASLNSTIREKLLNRFDEDKRSKSWKPVPGRGRSTKGRGLGCPPGWFAPIRRKTFFIVFPVVPVEWGARGGGGLVCWPGKQTGVSGNRVVYRWGLKKIKKDNKKPRKKT